MRVNLLLRGFGLQHNDGMFRLDALNLTFNGTPEPRFIRSAKDFHCCHGSQQENGGDCQLRVRDKLLPQVEELKYLRSFFPKI